MFLPWWKNGRILLLASLLMTFCLVSMSFGDAPAREAHPCCAGESRESPASNPFCGTALCDCSACDGMELTIIADLHPVPFVTAPVTPFRERMPHPGHVRSIDYPPEAESWDHRYE